MTSDEMDRRMLGALLRIPFQAIVARIAAGLAARGFADLRPAQFAVFQLVDSEGTRLTDLAERAQVTKQSMGGLVDALEAGGYVERLQDPSDRRAKIVRLTHKGWAVDAAAREILRETEAEWGQALGRERILELKATLKDLIGVIESGDSPG